ERIRTHPAGRQDGDEGAGQTAPRRPADAGRRPQERRDRGRPAAGRRGRADDPQAPAQAARGVRRGLPQGRTRRPGRRRGRRGRRGPRLPPPAPLSGGAERRRGDRHPADGCDRHEGHGEGHGAGDAALGGARGRARALRAGEGEVAV
ncbi:MAG: Transamidase GatB domain protein, partial [uncultured Rubrobacteraceae bacterium]